MGKINLALNSYMNRGEILADFCNGSLYKGRQFLSPLQFAEIQRFYHEDLKNRAMKKQRIHRERDVAMALCRNGHFVILGVENQDRPHLFMPLRLLEYDITEYLRQLRRLKRHNKELGGLTGEELLSGIRRTDRLIPAATLVFYHGKGPWDAPMELAELLDLSGLDDTISALLVNHRICFISLADLNENNFRTGLRELIGMMKRRDDKKAMLSFCMENKERFSHLDDETYDIICLALNLKTLALERKSSRNGGKENDNDMCKAFRDLMHDCKMEGKREGENMLARLIDTLLTENRLEDIKKVTQNLAFRRKLYQEYGIQ